MSITFLNLLLSLLFTLSSNASPDTKIVGGEPAQVKEFPFIVSVQDRDGHRCGGMLIGDRWVLTAAHCIDKSRLRVVYGVTSLDQKSRRNTVKVRKVYVHPKYNPETIDYDFAILKLRKRIKAPYVQLNRNKIKDHEQLDLTAIGWGLLNEEGYDISNSLQKVTVPFVPSKLCNESYQEITGISDRMICAGLLQGGKDACQGDSGGPLVYSENGAMKLVGVVSWGKGCARKGFYGVYSRVSSVINWIYRTLK